MSEKFDIIKQNFIKIYEKDIVCDIPIDKIYIQNVDQVTNYIYNIDDITDNVAEKLIFKDRFQYSTIKKIVYHDKLMRFSRWTCDALFYPFSKASEYLINKIEQIGHYDTFIHFFTNNLTDNLNYTKANIIILVEQIDCQQINLCYYASKKIYEAGILNRKINNNRSGIFFELLNRSIIEKKNKEAELECTIILNTPINNVDVDNYDVGNLNEKLNNIKLYNYQKADILWMSKIKNNIDMNLNSIKITYSEYNKVTLRDHLKLDEYKTYLIYDGTILPNAIVEDNSMYVHYYGGNIISSVGLGKTIITLSYLVQNFENNYDKYVCFETDYCNYFYKRGKNKGRSCIKKKTGTIYCKEHSNTLFIDKRKTILNKDLLESFSLRDNIIEINFNWRKKKLFKTNASLILCPNQLCDQWVREYYEHFKQNDKSKRVLLIVTYDQYCNITFGELLFADIIIVSYDFLKNTNYLRKQRENIYPHMSSTDIISTLNILDEELNMELDMELDETRLIDTSICRILDKFNVKLNILDNFYYQNIIYDESHELSNNIFNHTLSSFSSKYKWNITATPFANGIDSFINSISNIIDYPISYEYINKNLVKSFSQLFRRNTKESVKIEYTSPIVSDTLKLLEFTEQERRIYDAHSINKNGGVKDFLIKLCCDTSIDVETKYLVKNCKTLDEIESVILNHNKKKLSQLKKLIEDQVNKIVILEEQVNIGYIPAIIGFNFENNLIFTMEDLRSTLGNIRRSLTVTKKEYNDINRTYIFLKSAIDNIKTIETCPICLDETISDIAITKCGHKFCKDCIYEYVEEMGNKRDTKCPKCNIPIKLDEIYLLKEIEEIQLIDNLQNDLNNLIQRVRSTKIGNIIFFIKNLLKETDKCIIFSQWDILLTKIGRLLTAEKIIPLFCTGTIYQKKKSIKSFQEDPNAKIICLSSESCAAGINLTAANKIILVEPVYGSKQHRIDIENQSIGRSARIGNKRPIEVIRFIIKDTIEEDIYNDNEKDLNYNIIDTEPLRLKEKIIEL